MAKEQEEQQQEGSSLSANAATSTDRKEDVAMGGMMLGEQRRRLRSEPFVGRDMDISNGFAGMALNQSANGSSSQDDGRRTGGLRAMIRRASVSLRSRQRRQSQVEEREERPQTAWKRLKTATSFHRNSRFMSGSTSEDMQDPFLTPVPGHGDAPPLIPRGSGGAQARATAAMQNEYLRRHMFLPEDQFGDRESGIGIAVSVADPVDTSNRSINGSISRIDFMADLPTELASLILEYLDHTTLRNTALVSRRWKDLSSSQYVWRQVFMREQTKTFATSEPVKPGAGLGVPNERPDNDWKDLFRIKEELRQNWTAGLAEAVYLNGHLDSIYCVQYDENKIITGSRDKTIRIWDMNTYECKLVIGPPEVIADPDIMADSNGNSQHYATMPACPRKAESWPELRSFPMHHHQSILCLQYDEEILVTGSSDGTCIIYDIKDGYRPIRRLQHHSAAVLDLAFDKRYIVTCSKDVSICIWDRETGGMLKQLRGHAGPVNAVQMRDNTIVSCSGDFKVKLWNIDTGKNIKELAGHTKGLACSQYSEDSRFIASAGNDKIIRIWDANTGECLKRINAHENLVRSLHIDSISGRLISGSYDQDIKVFDIASGALLLEFPKWHSSWVLAAKSDYRRIISTGQDPKILIMDFGMKVRGIEKLKSEPPAVLGNAVAEDERMDWVGTV